MTKLALPSKTSLIRLAITSLRPVYSNRPAPLWMLVFLRHLVSAEDGLMPEIRSVTASGKALRNPFLRQRLAHEELGAWTIGVKTLSLLEMKIKALQPATVVEFGSGISTACLTRYMQEAHGLQDRTYVISIDQDETFAQKTRELLSSCGLEKMALVLHAPLKAQQIEGEETRCYDFTGMRLEEHFEHWPVTFVFIDGPAAEFGARFGTLPLLYPFMRREAHFFLDDALRDSELWIAQKWKRLPYLRLEGIYLQEKGLLGGKILGRGA